MSLPHLFFALGSILILQGMLLRGWYLLLIWVGSDFIILGLAHLRRLNGIFGKRANGTLAIWNQLLFFPLLTFTNAVWHLMRLIIPEAPSNKVTDDLVIGRRLLPGEIQQPFENYVDLTAEFSEPRLIRKSDSYHCFPILDGAAPSAKSLHDAIRRLRPGRTFVHCAQGHGRTGLFAAALLVGSGKASSVEVAIRMLTDARPGVCLNKQQLRCLKEYVDQFCGAKVS